MKCPPFLVTVDITREFVVKHCGSYYRFFLRKKTWAAVLPVIRKEGNSDPNKLQMQDLIRIKDPAKQNHRPITVCKENRGKEIHRVRKPRTWVAEMEKQIYLLM